MVGMTRAHICDPEILPKIQGKIKSNVRICAGANVCIASRYAGKPIRSRLRILGPPRISCATVGRYPGKRRGSWNPAIWVTRHAIDEPRERLRLLSKRDATYEPTSHYHLRRDGQYSHPYHLRVCHRKILNRNKITKCQRTAAAGTETALHNGRGLIPDRRAAGKPQIVQRERDGGMKRTARPSLAIATMACPHIEWRSTELVSHTAAKTTASNHQFSHWRVRVS